MFDIWIHFKEFIGEITTPEALPTTTAIISCLAGILTLGVTVVTLAIAHQSHKVSIKAYNQIDREEPWKLTKIKDDYWLLERVHPTYATIYGQGIFPAKPKGEINAWGNSTIEYRTLGNEPYIYFKRGMKIVMIIPESEAPIGSSLQLYYKEHRHQPTKKDHEYYGNISPHAESEKGIKTWDSPLY